MFLKNILEISLAIDKVKKVEKNNIKMYYKKKKIINR